MANHSTSDSRWRDDARFLLPCLAVALLLRLWFFNGVSLHDDVNYWMQSIATGLHGAWPPLATHWHTRIGFVLPCAVLLKIFGLHVWVPYVFTVAGGLAEVALTFYLARQFVPVATARLAAWLCAFYPLDILYSSYLFTDLWAGVITAVSLFYWYRALTSDRARDYALASLFFGLAWLCRETIVLCAPIYLVLWLHAGRWRRPQLLWALPPGLAILAGEAALYHFTIGNWHYRLDSITASKGQLMGDLEGAGNLWTGPLKELVTSHELGLYMLGGLVVCVGRFGRVPRVLGLWLLTGFIWMSWGTTMPTAWVPLLPDPRYLSIVTIPCMVVLAIFFRGIRSPVWRAALVGALIVIGLLGVAADYGDTKLTAHRKFVASVYNQPETALEPFVYFGARAAQDFRPAEARYACATDLGRVSMIDLVGNLPAVRTMTSGEARYLALSEDLQPEKWRKKLAEGWRKVEEIPGESRWTRRHLSQLLAACGLGAVFADNVPALLILENPRWPAAASALPR